MGFRLPNRKPTSATLGVDIGHDLIKAVELQPGRGGLELVAAASAATPPGTVADGLVTNPEAVGQALRSLLRANGMRARQAVGSVSGPLVNVRPISLPRMSEADARRSLVFEAQKHFSFSPEDTIVEGEILETDNADTPEMLVMVVTAPRSQVDSHTQAIECAGLDPIAMDVGIFAKLRALLEFPKREEELGRPIAVVDLGGSYTEVSILQSGMPVWMRVIPIGGTTLTRALADSLGLEWEEATQAKEAMDAVRLGSTEGLSPAESSMQSALEELMREMRRSINFYNSQMESSGEAATIEKVHLLGGGARMTSMPEYLSDALRLEVETGQMAGQERLSCRPAGEAALGSDFPFYAQAIGLAMWEFLAAQRKRRGV